MVAYGKHAHYAVSLHHLGSLHDVVGRERSLAVKLACNGRFGAHRFASQRRFVDVQQRGFYQFAVGRNLLARVYNHYVAHNDLVAWYLCRV